MGTSVEKAKIYVKDNNQRRTTVIVNFVSFYLQYSNNLKEWMQYFTCK